MKSGRATTPPRKSRSGGPPIYTPETAEARRIGDIRLRLTPERAASLRALAKTRGVSLVALVSEWIDAAGLPGGFEKRAQPVLLPLALGPPSARLIPVAGATRQKETDTMTKTIKSGTEATIQMGSLFIGCTVARVLRNGAAIVLRDSKDGTEYQATRNRAGEYRYEKAYRVRLNDGSSDNRATWLD